MLAQEMKEHLTTTIIPFWKKMRDDENGGYYGWMDYDLKIDKKAIKGCVLNSRVTWFFANAYMLLKDEELLDYAKHGFDFMKAYCIDRKYGGVYWSIRPDARPEDTEKHTYNQAFAIYALSSYYEASGNKTALDMAMDLFHIIEEKCMDEFGYKECFNRGFEEIDNDKLSENGVIAEKTMNTLLHVYEAYTELYRVGRCEAVKERMLWIMDTFKNKVYNPKLRRQEVFFDEEMNSILDLHSYGHDIETAWLIDRGLDILKEEKYEKLMRPVTESLTEHVYKTAFDGNSLANECEKGVVDESRIWWVQAEAVVGFLNGYERNPYREEYRQAAESEWKFIKEHIADKRQGGEWYWKVDKEGKPIEGAPIVEPWKCPYHNGRMCFEVIRRAAMLHKQYYKELQKYEALINRKNETDKSFYNGIYNRYKYPVLTREHIPLTWQYDLNVKTNPYFMKRLGINAVMNSGAIELNGKYYLVARIEGDDRKSFFGVAESNSGTDGFRFWDYPILLPDKYPQETNVYDMRLTKHEDGYIYGLFCSESKDNSVNDLSAAVAAAGIVRTKDLKTWERLDNLVTENSPQQRNVVLHPEFIDGKYAFYTRPMDDFIETGSGGGIGFGLCGDITHAVIGEEKLISLRKYHTITEAKNGAGAVPVKTEKGWIHIAHGVRNTAAGLRYVIYAFATDLEDPSRIIAEPSGLLIGPREGERIGDVSNVVFTNGAIVNKNGEVFIYYASGDTRLHVAVTTIDKLTDYVFRTPEDPLRSVECVKQRYDLIEKNLEYLNKYK